jgi:choice-of-anchor B domain-containing protein
MKKPAIFHRMNYILFSFVMLYFSDNLTAQNASHMELLCHVKMLDNGSSIWGYTSSDGNEYALLGTNRGVRIYSLANPRAPVELAFIECSPSAWRELKTAGAFAYVVTEAADGLLIIDLRTPLDSIPYRFVKKFKDISGDSLSIITAHTLYVDEKNFIYLSGASPIGGGFIILDPRTDPFNPIILNHNEDQYMHEVHVYHDTLYGAELYFGVFSIWDIKDRGNPMRISEAQTAYHFTHSVWIEKNRNILYTADEVAGAVIESWDVSDPSHIVKADEFRVKNPAAPFIIPHNVFHHKDKLYISYYTEGVRVVDTKDPENLIEVAYYDTHDLHAEGFHGCWSVYPYFESGICIASDIEGGMFVLKYDGNEPLSLNAFIVDKQDGTPIYNASLKIEQGSRIIEEFSDLKGVVKTGCPEEDSITITVYKKGYYEHTFQTKLLKQTNNSLKIELTELPKHNLQIIVKDKLTGELIPDAKIILYNTDFTINSSTDITGESKLNNVYRNKWTLVVGKWSYKQYALTDFELNDDQVIIAELEEGYEDDFILDLGWTTTGTDPRVKWKIGDFSEATIPPSNFPSKDIEGDLGTTCYYTDNYISSSTEHNIHGEINHVSPPMNLSEYENIELSYYPWAYGGYTSFKQILFQTPDTTLLLKSVPELLTGVFNPIANHKFDLTGLKKDSVHFIFRLYNDSATAEMAIRLMGALDVFRLTGTKIVSTNDKNSEPRDLISVYPNPVNDVLFIESKDKLNFEPVKIYNVYGELVKKCTSFIGSKAGIDVGELESGIYYLKLGSDKMNIKFIKTTSK